MMSEPISCEHLQGLREEDFPPPRTPNACEECLSEGKNWVSLRECQACGHVGCCDSSLGRHAEKHFRATQHPVMRATAPQEWTWCYVHEAQGRVIHPAQGGERKANP
jgi:hypothetical protein